MKVGDKVICIHVYDSIIVKTVLTINKVYEVNDTWNDFIRLTNDIQDELYYEMKMFRLLSDYRNDLIDVLIK